MVCRTGKHLADIAQANVNDGQESTRDDTRGDCAANQLATFGKTSGAQRGNDDDAESQTGDGVHRQVAFEQAGGECGLRIFFGSRQILRIKTGDRRDHQDNQQDC